MAGRRWWPAARPGRGFFTSYTQLYRAYPFLPCRQSIQQPLQTQSSMDEDELYFFDLCGYICVRGVLSAQEVAAANASVDAHAAEAMQAGHRKGAPRIPEGKSLEDASRWDYRGMLGWEPEESRAPFVNMLAHPKLTRYLNTICGRGFRMDQ